MELHRLKSQQNQRSYAARERKQEDEVKERQEIETEFEQVLYDLQSFFSLSSPELLLFRAGHKKIGGTSE